MAKKRQDFESQEGSNQSVSGMYYRSSFMTPKEAKHEREWHHSIDAKVKRIEAQRAAVPKDQIWLLAET